ncbi:LPD7 domain-containing protein [Acetobacter persici]|uniref:LPD7 domain-containing protein n=1 Tax=Acetobacter persici TaxID=1076596 RepID=UPI001BA67584|nr:LPD7 domain-containing protein [Acetobacter persici]MBS1017242.1 hypothetical protein [Acetobacter persici]
MVIIMQNKDKNDSSIISKITGIPSTPDSEKSWLRLLKDKIEEENGGYSIEYEKSKIFIDDLSICHTGEIEREAIKDIVTIIKCKGWSSIKLNGSESFKDEVYAQIKAEGLKVFTNHKPTNTIDINKRIDYIKNNNTGEQDNESNKWSSGTGRGSNYGSGSACDDKHRDILQCPDLQNVSPEKQSLAICNSSSGTNGGYGIAGTGKQNIRQSDDIFSLSAPDSGLHNRLDSHGHTASPESNVAQEVSDSKIKSRYTKEEILNQFNSVFDSLVSPFSSFVSSDFIALNEQECLNIVKKLDDILTVYYIYISPKNRYSMLANEAVQNIKKTAENGGFSDALACFYDYSPALFSVPQDVTHNRFLNRAGKAEIDINKTIYKIKIAITKTQKESEDVIKAIKHNIHEEEEQKKRLGFFKFSARKIVDKNLLDLERDLFKAQEYEKSDKFRHNVKAERRKLMYEHMPVHLNALEAVIKPYQCSPPVALAFHSHGPEMALNVLFELVKGGEIKLVSSKIAPFIPPSVSEFTGVVSQSAQVVVPPALPPVVLTQEHEAEDMDMNDLDY